MLQAASMRAASAQAAPASFRLRQQKGGASRAALAAPRSRPSRGAATRLRAVSQAPADTLEATADKASSAEVVVAPAPEKKVEWWEKHHARNMVTVTTARGLRRVLQRANDLGTTRLVVVEFFAPFCPACRTLFPKLVSIARDEFPELLFVKLNITGTSETEQLCKELGVETLPTFQLYSGALGRVAQFGASLNASSLERLRTMLTVHSSHRTSFVPGQLGPASVFHADGWPAIERHEHDDDLALPEFAAEGAR